MFSSVNMLLKYTVCLRFLGNIINPRVKRPLFILVTTKERGFKINRTFLFVTIQKIIDIKRTRRLFMSIRKNK
jgi:hypothetical protein